MQQEKVIAILFDLQGTIDNLNEKNCIPLMNQIEVLRKHFEVEKVLLTVSSHIYEPNSLQKYLELFEKFKHPNFIVDESFYLFGTYNHITQEKTEKGFGYNLNKTRNFENKYFSIYDVVWFAVIDDSISSSYTENFKDTRPMIVCRPSQKNEDSLLEDNFMCYSSLLPGIEGISSCLLTYLKRIMFLNIEEIMEKQKNMATPLELCIQQKNLAKLEELVVYGDLSKIEYEDIAAYLNSLLLLKNYSKLELTRIQNIMKVVCKQLCSSHQLIKQYTSISAL